MTTRREKLVAILDAATEQGISTADLASRARAFKASGKSGIEPFINETLADLTAPSKPDVSAVVQSALDDLQHCFNEAVQKVKAAV